MRPVWTETSTRADTSPGGVIEEIGPKVTKEWQKGDRVCGFVHGGNTSQHEDGAFGEYVVMKGDLGLKVSVFAKE